MSTEEVLVCPRCKSEDWDFVKPGDHRNDDIKCNSCGFRGDYDDLSTSYYSPQEHKSMPKASHPKPGEGEDPGIFPF